MTMTASLPTAEQQQKVWSELLAHNNYPPQENAADSLNEAAAASSEHPSSSSSSQQREWPTYDHVMGDMADANYDHTLTCPFDIVKNLSATSGCSKTICSHGAVCCAKLELFARPADDDDNNNRNAGYTGLLKAGTSAEHCILRLSSAMKPPNLEITSTWARALLYATGEKLRNAKLFPTAALKVFRSQGIRSGNLLFGGSKIGQREADYFAHCMCTTMTEQMPRGVKPFVRKFWRYSDYPLSLGTSDFCTHTVQGSQAETVEFPFALILRPYANNQAATASSTAAGDTDTANTGGGGGDFADSFDIFLDNVLSTPVGTVLFDVFACPDPNIVPYASKLQRIGRITTTSRMIQSAPDDGLFFRHQKKEEDYDLRPSWRQALKAQVTIDQGKTKGTIGRLAGWKLFEEHINQDTFDDFEKPN